VFDFLTTEAAATAKAVGKKLLQVIMSKKRLEIYYLLLKCLLLKKTHKLFTF
jgi:hypothetical protein